MKEWKNGSQPKRRNFRAGALREIEAPKGFKLAEELFL